MSENNQNMQETANQNVEETAVQTTATVGKFAITADKAMPVYCTIDKTTMAGRMKLYHITSHPDHTLSEYINKTIRIKDIYVDVNQRTVKDGENAGQVEDKPRTIIIDDNGESYISGVSLGIYQAVREIIRIFGDPRTWDEPLPVRVVQISTPRGNMLSLDIDM